MVPSIDERVKDRRGHHWPPRLTQKYLTWIQVILDQFWIQTLEPVAHLSIKCDDFKKS